jgi:superfamily II DNA/RNA helicase
MFDPITVDLITHAPPLKTLDLESLPRRFTNAYAEIVAGRVRMRGLIDPAGRTEALDELIKEMRRLAAAQEAFVAINPTRQTRESAAFVAASAHQLCMMAEAVAARLETGSEDDDGEGAGDSPPDQISVTDEPTAVRDTFIDTIRVAPELCATLLFLIADAQPDAAEMAKRIRPPSGMTGEAYLIGAIANLANGTLTAINQIDEFGYVPITDTSPIGLATDALLRRLHAGVQALAAEILSRPTAVPKPSAAKEIFVEVKNLSIERLDAVFDEAGPIAVSIFPGPLHLANLLLAVSGDLIEAGICRTTAPPSISANAWWKIVRQASRKRPYLWRNHRNAIAQGYLTPGVSAAVSFPTGGGKSTLAELKIATALLTEKKVVVLAPTIALVDQTASQLQTAFKDYDVQGDLDEEVSFSDIIILPEIIVTTPERCLMMQSLQAEAFAEVGLIVFDECHLLHPRDADRSRRGVDAMLCILNLTQTAQTADLLMISAMMQNAGEMAGWIADLTGRKTLALDLAWKPTRQARGCVTYLASRVMQLERLLSRARQAAVTKEAPKPVRDQLTAQPFAFFCLRQTWTTTDRADYALMPLLDEAVPFNSGTSKQGNWYLTPNGNRVAVEIAAAAAGAGLKTLIFVQSTVASEGSVKQFRKRLPDRRVKLNDYEAAVRLRTEEEMGGPQFCYLQLDSEGEVIGGATSHHGQLIPDERDLHRSLFARRDGLNALFATSTIAQGMNLPSDIVLIAGDSRWDDSSNKMQQLDTHELLNAAGRAGRAGESGQGFVLVIPSRIVDFDDDANKIDKHWLSLQAIFAQSDQCLIIDDPLNDLLDRIHSEVATGDTEDYLLARLPTGSGEDPDDPARTLLKRSFAVYRKRIEGKTEWIESRINAALALRGTRAPAKEDFWLAQVASSAGQPINVLVSLLDQIDQGALSGNTMQCMSALFMWLEQSPEFVLQVLRPSGLEGLFGKAYKALPSDIDRARHALPVIRCLTERWMAGDPLCRLELAVGVAPEKLGTCEVARHFAARVAADISFLAGLPARILAARAVTENTAATTTVITTLSSAARRGCDSPEALANAVHLSREVSRVSARKIFEDIKDYIPVGSNVESFDLTLDRVKSAHDIAMLF